MIKLNRQRFEVVHNPTGNDIRVRLAPNDVLEQLGRGFLTYIDVPADECRLLPLSTWVITGRRLGLKRVSEEWAQEHTRGKFPVAEETAQACETVASEVPVAPVKEAKHAKRTKRTRKTAGR